MPKTILPKLVIIVLLIAFSVIGCFLWPEVSLKAILFRASRSNVATDLSRFDSRILSEELLRGSHNKETTSNLLRALSSRTDPSAKQAILTVARSSDAEMSAIAIREMRWQKLTGPEEQSLLVEKLASTSTLEGAVAAATLTFIIPTDDLVALVSRSIDAASEKSTKIRMLKYYADIAPDTSRIPSELFLTFLRYPDLEMRQLAVHGLAAQPHRKHVFEFIRLLSDPSEAIRNEASSALQRIVPSCPVLESGADATTRGQQMLSILSWLRSNGPQIGPQIGILGQDH